MAEKVGSFELYGLKELQKSLDKVRAKYPQEVEKKIYALAGQFTKDANANLELKNGTAKELKKAWHRKRQKEGGQTEAVEIWNTDRKFHLLEHGHAVRMDPQHYAAYKAGKLDRSKRSKFHRKGKKNPRLQYRGFAEGKHFTEKTREQWKTKYPSELRSWLDEILKSENL